LPLSGPIIKLSLKSFAYLSAFLYQSGIDHEGNKLGDHEVKTLKLSFNDYTKDSDA